MLRRQGAYASNVTPTPSAGTAPNSPSRSRRLAASLWIVFSLGLALQAFSSHLEIAHNAFVIPPSLTASRVGLNPSEVVSRERRLQALSGLLVLGGAIGLAIHYRHVLRESFMGRGK